MHWGYFSKLLKPQLEVDSGDYVTIEAVTHHAGDDTERMVKGDPGVESIYLWTKEKKGVNRRGAGPIDGKLLVRGAGEGFFVSMVSSAAHTKRLAASHSSRLLECTQCGAIRVGGEPCFHCGFLPQRLPRAVDIDDGELGLVDHQVRRAKANIYDLAERARWHAMLVHVAMERGYKPGWAAHKYKEKFGTWPPWGSLPRPISPLPEVRSWVRSRLIAYAKGRGRHEAAEEEVRVQQRTATTLPTVSECGMPCRRRLGIEINFRASKVPSNRKCRTPQGENSRFRLAREKGHDDYREHEFCRSQRDPGISGHLAGTFAEPRRSR